MSEFKAWLANPGAALPQEFELALASKPGNPPAPEPRMTPAKILYCLRAQADAHYAQAEFGLTLAHPDLLNQAADLIERLTKELQTKDTKL